MVRILLWSSAVRVHDSQAYRKMDMSRECVSHILELRKMHLSFQTSFNFVNDAVVCAILAISANLIRAIKHLYDRTTSAVPFNGSIGYPNNS